MLAKYEQVCYELLRPEQVKELREKCPIVYIVAGSLEWHSWQNPLGTDSLKAHAICCEAALKYGGVVLPPFYQGLTGVDNWGPDGWRGYTQAFNEHAMFEAAMRGIVKAMIYGQWKVIVGITGHDVPDQMELMQKAIEEETRGTGAVGFAAMEGTFHDPDEEIPYAIDHAAAWETSCMMYAYPEKVDMDALKRHIVSNEDWLEIFAPDGSRNPEGIMGANPLKFATPEMGRKIIERMADQIGSRARKLLEENS
ncbi:MAG TPA: creatininase family protein [Armatimonadota bacterium]|nr:creatininase family protein [Armatimonadota bacterium]HOM72825.1 creatininase family protein [Armatimonadota bacterium]HPP74057.1 creatininase family protein [Armatimonadota bacterium]